MKKILVTGINGFFASRFADFYKSKYAVTGISHQQLDITDADQTLKIIQANSPDCIVHAAAIADTMLCWDFCAGISVLGCTAICRNSLSVQY